MAAGNDLKKNTQDEWARNVVRGRRGSKARIVLLPSRITRWGLYHIA